MTLAVLDEDVLEKWRDCVRNALGLFGGGKKFFFFAEISADAHIKDVARSSGT